jgi:hypothetical protein
MPKHVKAFDVKRARNAMPGAQLYEDKDKVLEKIVGVDDSGDKHWSSQFAFFTLLIVILLALTLVISYGIFTFSSFIQVSSAAGRAILIRLCLVMVVSILLVKFRISKGIVVMPLIFFGMCWSIYPALNYWLYGS